MMIRIRSSLGTWRIQLKQFATPTLQDVKNTIFNEYQIPLENQSLTLDIEGNKVIQPDTETLQALGIKNGDLLFLSGRLEKQVINKSYVGENGNVVAAGVKIQLKSEIDQKGSDGLKISKRLVDGGSGGDTARVPNQAMESDIKKSLPSTKLHQHDEKKVLVEQDNKNHTETKEELPKINNNIDVGEWEYYDTDDKNSFNSPDVRAPDAVKVSNLMYDDDDNDNLDMEFDNDMFRFRGSMRRQEDEYVTKLPDNMNSEAMAEALAAGIPEHELLMDILTSNQTAAATDSTVAASAHRGSYRLQRNLSDSNINNYRYNGDNILYQEFDDYIDRRSRDSIIDNINTDFPIPVDFYSDPHVAPVLAAASRDSSNSIRYGRGLSVVNDDDTDFDSIDHQMLQLAMAESEAMIALSNSNASYNTSTASTPPTGDIMFNTQNHTAARNINSEADEQDDSEWNDIEEDHELRMLGLSQEEIQAQKHAMLAILNDKKEKLQRRNDTRNIDPRINSTSVPTSRANSSSTSSDVRSVPRHLAATNASSVSTTAAAGYTKSSAQRQDKKVISATNRDFPISVTGTSSTLLANAGRRSIHDSSSSTSIQVRSNTSITSTNDMRNSLSRRNSGSSSNNINSTNSSSTASRLTAAAAALPTSSTTVSPRSQSTGHRRKSSTSTSTSPRNSSSTSTHPRVSISPRVETTTASNNTYYSSQQMDEYHRQQSAFYDINNMDINNMAGKVTTSATPNTRPSINGNSKLQAPLRQSKYPSNTTTTPTPTSHQNNNVTNSRDTNRNNKSKNKSSSSAEVTTNNTSESKCVIDETSGDAELARLLAKFDEDEYAEFMHSTRSARGGSSGSTRGDSGNVPPVNIGSSPRNNHPVGRGDRELTFGDVYAPRVSASSTRWDTGTASRNTTSNRNKNPPPGPNPMYRPVQVQGDSRHYPRPTGPKPNSYNTHTSASAIARGQDRQIQRNLNDNIYSDLSGFVAEDPPSEIRGGRPYFPENYVAGNRYNLTDSPLAYNPPSRNNPYDRESKHTDIDDDDEEEALAFALALSLQTK